MDENKVRKLVGLLDFKEQWEELKEEYGSNFSMNQKSVEQAKRIAQYDLTCPSIFILRNGNIRFVFDTPEYFLGLQFIGYKVQLVYTNIKKRETV